MMGEINRLLNQIQTDNATYNNHILKLNNEIRIYAQNLYLSNQNNTFIN